MRKSIKVVLTVLSVGLLGWGAFFGLSWLSFQMRFWQERYIECNPESLLQKLEKKFGIDFPVGIKQIKTAKTLIINEESVRFIVKFAADPNTVDRFLASFPKEALGVDLEPYAVEFDGRCSITSPLPRWFKEPIRQGKWGYYGFGYGDQHIYIDTTNRKSFIVYVYGSYAVE